MSFLVPLYLLGALAVAIPIYLHLRRKPPKDSVEFGSLMFLRPTPYPPAKRRSQLENVPLLILRCLALLALAGLFARPFLRGGDKEVDEGQGRTVLLIDTSASMRRAGLWDAAIGEAGKLVDSVKPDGALALVTVADTARTVVGFADWMEVDASRRKSVARSALESLEPGWEGTDLGTGLLTAAELLADASADEESPRNARVVVISDLQNGAALDAVAGASWPSGITVELRPVEARQSTNATLAVAPGPDPRRPMVRVTNAGASEGESFRLKAGDREIPAVVPAGESRVFELPDSVGEVTLVGDAQDFDNRLFLAPREPESVVLRFVGEGAPDDPDGPEYYFRRAFGASELMQPRFAEDFTEEASIVAVARPLDQAESGAIRRELEAGGRVLLVVTSTGMADTLGGLLGLGESPEISEADGRYAMLEGIDFEHPVLAEFGDPRWRDFTGVHFWKHRKLQESALPDARVLARFDNGDPAWLEMAVGKGSLLVMASGWHPRDSQLALSSKFVPLLYSIFADRGPRAGEVRQFFVGDPLPLEAGDRSVTGPDGGNRRLEAGERIIAREPGVYRIEGEHRTRHYAVNLRRSESDLQPLARPALVALGVPLAGSPEATAAPESEAGKRRLRDQEAEANQNLWRWAAVILLILLGVESWIASRAASPMQSLEGAPS